MSEEPKHLSDEDIERIAKLQYQYLKRDLFINAGKGFLGFAWKGMLLIALGFAVYYFNHGGAGHS